MKKLTSLLTALTMVSGMAFAASAEGVSFALGDVDMDGFITGHDTAMVSRYVTMGDITLSEEQLKLADVDGDGAVTQADADKLYNEMQEYVLGDIDLINGPQCMINGEVIVPPLDYSVVEIKDSFQILHMLYMKIIDPNIDFNGKFIRADVNCDGVVNSIDALFTLNLYARCMVFQGDYSKVYSDGKYYFDMTEEEQQKELQENYKYAFPDAETLEEAVNMQIGLNTPASKYIDIDGDDELTVSDTTSILKIYTDDMANVNAGIYKASANTNEKADLNLDGYINMDDASLALKAYAMSMAGLI